MLVRTGRAVAALAAGGLLAGCHFAIVPPKHPQVAHPSATRSLANPYGYRIADAPALLVQCAISGAGLRPGTGLSWLSHGKVSINSSNAADFATWWQGHDSPGPYAQTFLIDGHRTHYLSFGTSWVRKNGQWVPAHAARSDPQSERYALAGWATWTASNGSLPAPVCGTSQTVRQLQAQVFGTSAPDPWSS
jgi:hypothetical protein